MKSLNTGMLIFAVVFCTAGLVHAQQKETPTERPEQNKANNPHIEAREEAKREHKRTLNQDKWREEAQQRKDSDMKRPEAGH